MPRWLPLNPRLVYCSITGYGQTGPYRDRAGYDFIIQAQGGLMSITGPEEGEPHKVGVAIVDISAGLFAATAILAALHERERSGQGQYIDVALLDAQVAWLANVAQNYLATGQPPGRFGNAHPSIVPYEPFPTADGAVAVAVGARRTISAPVPGRRTRGSLRGRTLPHQCGSRHPPRRADPVAAHPLSHAHHPGMGGTAAGDRRAGG
jgi:crotonobetainyl-CoA:carnitine CoA-transferase CaiB-like acyl-CoA transferase